MAETVEYVRFHDDSETDSSSYKNRIEQLYKNRELINKLMAKNELSPSTDYKKFLELKALDAKGKDDVQPSDISTNPSSPIEASTISDEESAAIEASVESMQATEFVQLFLDSYMSPIGSDIDYRLGKVVGIKEYLYNDGGYTYPDYDHFGQYDKYGRIDTTLNLRLQTTIPGIGVKYYKWVNNPKSQWQWHKSWVRVFSKYKYVGHYHNTGKYVPVPIIPPYNETYVNFFFPPYSLNAFSDATSLRTNADYYIKTRKWNKITKTWEYEDGFDPDEITYDTGRLLSMRKNPTYRLPAYKAINDNIMFLQHVFEQTCGIVSTYLTEWDISIYIQEGLLTGKENKAPSYLTLTNRINQDNPSGYTDSRAFVYGALNAAVSKTPIDVPTPNISAWTPSAYPYSTYWLAYNSVNRGDGLDVFYDVALGGFEASNLTKFSKGDGTKFSANYYGSLPFREKITRDDFIGAAFSGWTNWDTLYYWQALYTTSSDGLSSVDIIHMSIDESSSVFENTIDDDNNEVEGVIQQIINALYEESDDLGFETEYYDDEINMPEGNDPATIIKHYRRDLKTGDGIYLGSTRVRKNGDEEYYDSNNRVTANPPSTSVSGSGDGSGSDIKVCGCKIPGSRICKIFLNRSSKESRAMSIANKNKSNGYASVSSSSNSNIFGNNGTSDGSGTGSSNGSSGSSNNGSGNNSSDDTNYTSANGSSAVSSSSIVSMVDADANENGKYARTDGVSQWSPVLYGGPHGRNFSPKTVEGYFEENNEFYRNVPRINAGALSSNPRTNFSGVESRYAASGNNATGRDPYRSPSRGYSLLKEGYGDFTLQAVWCLVPKYFWSDVKNGWINGNWFWAISRGWSSEEYSTGFRTPISFMCNPYSNDYYPNCPHYYWKARYEWDNWNRYAHYYGGSRYWRSWLWPWYGSRYREDYALRYHKDYWGKLKICLHDCSKLGGDRHHHHRHYHGWTSHYQLMAVRSRYKYYCRYNQWEVYYYKRPLMHSNPNASGSSHWNITNGYRCNNVYCKWYNWHWWWNYWAHYMNGMYSRYNPTQSHNIAMVYSRSNRSNYRLTFPDSGVGYHRCTAWGWCDIRHREEQKFMEYVTGNAGAPGRDQDWHWCFFFLSQEGVSFSDRYNNGPSMIFQARVRRNYYSAPFWEWYQRREKHKCHHDWCWHRRVVYGSVPYIEVDMDNIQQVITGIKEGGVGGVSPWSNLSSSMLGGDKQEVYQDIVPGSVSKTVLPDSPFGYSGFPVWGQGSTQIWAGMGRDGNEFTMHGWGYATTMPGMEFYRPNPPDNMFENPNYYLNIKNVCGSSAQYRSINDLVGSLPFWTLDNRSPLIYVNAPNSVAHNVIHVQGVKRYSRISWLDPGLKKAFKNMYCTSTFFKFKEFKNGNLEDYLSPRLVTNDNGLRTLIKVVNHQKAWTEKAKEIFNSSISWRELRILIEQTTNTSILAASLPSSNSYNPASVFYHYWIEKAYNIFGDDTNKQTVINAFNTRIAVYTTFLNSVSRYLAKTSYSWSYNDYNTIYTAIRTLKEGTVGSKDYTIDETFYAYLNVLYEYRKFYINKRCNKIDGTLNTMRQLEGAIPLVCQQINNINPAGPGRTNTIFDSDSHTYKVSYYDIDNSNVAKIKTMIDPNTSLDVDRTMLLYIKVKYVDETAAQNYLEKCKNGQNNVLDQRYIWIPKKQKYAELPFDDLYRYESKEYNQNEAAKKFNAKATNYEKRELNKYIDDCVFSITWSDYGTMPMIERAKGVSKLRYRSKLGMGDSYPYVYQEHSDWKSRLNIQKNGAKVPMIKFDVQSGVDPSKLIDAQKAIQSDDTGELSAYDIMCTVGSKSDYWVVAIPPAARPRAVGYTSNLKIKTYVPPEASTKPNEATVAAAGVFGYSLYPVTEEQANTIPGIGLDISGIQASLQNSYLENYEDYINNSQTTD